ncbi:MAG: tetratricopeptide repeat protein [Acidobacteria bacterium]|nr:tetratricopeptide repeat protein [Acidobacteriota bacterium]
MSWRGLTTVNLVGFLLAILWVSPCAAQFDRSRGGLSISGRVFYAENNQPVNMALISLQNLTQSTMDQTYTDSNGSFSFNGLRGGSFYVRASLPGYMDATDNVELAGFSYSGLNLALRKNANSKTSTSGASTVSVGTLQVPARALEEYKAGLKLFTQEVKLEESLAHFRKAVEYYPNFANAYYWMGMVQIDQGAFDVARDSFAKAITLNEKLMAAYFPLGALYMQFKEPEKAEATLTKGLALNPKVWQGYYELARAYLTMHRLQEAEESALKALELKPDFPRMCLLLANVYWEQGNSAKALIEEEKFLTLAPDDPLAPEIRKRVEDLKKAQPAKP